MQTFKSYFSFKIGLLVFAGVFSVVSAVLALAPRSTNTAKSENCSGAPTVATLNPFPVSWAGTVGIDCTDAPAIAIRPVNSPAGSYSASVNAQSGEEFYIRIYVHNGAQQGLDYNQTTAFDVQGGVNISGNQIGTDFDGIHSDGSLTNTVSGSVSVNMPQGAHLEIIPGSQEFFDYLGNFQAGGGQASLGTASGTFSLGDMRACFEFSKFFRFKVKVVGLAVTGQNTIIAQAGGQVSGQCLRTGTVDWTNSSDVTAAEITVQDLTSNSTVNVLARNTNGHADTPWLTPLHTYQYIMYNTTFGQRSELARTNLIVPDLSCGATPPAASVTLSASPNPVCIGSSTAYAVTSTQDGTIIWTSTFNGQPTGENNAYYNQNLTLVNGKYTWSGLSDVWGDHFHSGNPKADVGAWTKTVSVNGTKSNTVTFQVKDCTPPVTQVTATATATASATAFASCPDGTRASASASASATATATAATYSEAYQLAYNKAFAQAQALAFAQAQAKVVCSNPPPPPPPPQLVCSPSNQTVDINQPASFTASGGTGSYSWQAPSGNPTSGSGNNFSSSYGFSGFKTVTVTSGSQTEQCTVKVREPIAPNAILQLTKTVKNISAGGGFAHTISAKQDEIVEYQIIVKAGNSTNLQNVRVTDEMPFGLSYVPDSLKVNGQPHAPGLTSGGLVFGTVNQNGISITYQAKVSVQSGTLVNLARAVADNAQSQTDRAFVNVIFVAPGQPALSVTKEVKNMGPSQTTGYSTSINAKKGDAVSYRITVANVGSATANNVFVSDNNPIDLSTATNLNVSKSYSGSLLNSITLGNLSAGQSVTITYQAVVSISQGTIQNIATVSAENASSKQAIAIVNVIFEQAGNIGGTCNNSDNSCNTNTNTNTQTNNNSTNSSNQNNNTNINGNNNTVTNTNQNCVNNSCNTNTVYINQAGNTVPVSEFRQLNVSKLVRLANGGAFQNSVSANNGDTVEFEIIVRNTGNQVVNNAQMSDTWNGNLSLINGSVRIDGNYQGDNLNNINLGSILSGQQRRVTFQARVDMAGNQSIQNTARAWGDGTGQVQDDAWVFISQVAGGNVNLSFSKRAFNDTKNADATGVTASREDFITYTLTVTNNGNAPAANFVITDDLSQVLSYADMVDNGGGILSGNLISYPGIAVPAGGSVQKSFRVRVKFQLAANLSYTMNNTYGNTVTVRINTPQVLGAFVAPKTGGPSLALASVFGSLLTGGLAVIRHRRKVWELIWE